MENLDCGEEARVLSISIAERANGKKVIAVQIGFESAIAEPKKDEPLHATINLQIPGAATQKRPAMPLELKVTLFFTEKEWEKAKDKFTVGNSVSFEFTKRGIEVVGC